MSNIIINYINRMYGATTLSGKLKPMSCPSCRADGEQNMGSCPQCLENQAYNREYLETHTFLHDSEFRPYHYSDHDYIKSLPLRLPNEHPYLYYGIELEIEFDSSDVNIGCPDDDDDYYDDDDEDRDDYNDNINAILARFSEITDGLFCYEKDGSLDNGVECISRPCSYAYWTDPLTVQRLKDGLEYLRSQGAYVDQPSTNGMHIHISRKFFDKGDLQTITPQTAYTNFDWLFQKFQPQLEKLAGREYTHYCESKASKLINALKNDSGYTANRFNASITLKATLKKGGEVARGDHYSSVNLGSNTIEARIFKSTTDYEQVLANIELVRNFAHAVREDDIKKSLDDLLHTKDNLYLDKLIRKTRLECKRKGDEFDLDTPNDDTIEVEFEG